MRVAVLTESFLPRVNGVTNSVLRTLEHLERRGHEALVVAPGRDAPATYAGAAVHDVASLSFPGYRDVRMSAVGAARIEAILERFRPDVVHLASPFLIGGPAVRAAERLDVPVVAVYQTDVAGFATRYHLTAAAGAAWRRIERIHRRAARTLAPSRAALEDLEAHGIPRVRLWPRGVDADLFSPARRDAGLRAELAPRGQVLVGYVGRLASEKRVEDLAVLASVPGVRLVVVGEGPQRAKLERELPGAAFLGLQRGEDLARAVASLDVFVHPGPHETFCQAAQEALASGIPVVAPASGGLLDLVEPGRTGWLYPAGDLRALRGYVAALSREPDVRAAFGAAARASVLPRTWESVGDALLEHYADALLDRPALARGA